MAENRQEDSELPQNYHVISTKKLKITLIMHYNMDRFLVKIDHHMIDQKLKITSNYTPLYGATLAKSRHNLNVLFGAVEAKIDKIPRNYLKITI